MWSVFSGRHSLLPPANMEMTSQRYEVHSFRCGVRSVFGGRPQPPTKHTPHSTPGAAGATEKHYKALKLGIDRSFTMFAE
ncbi:hypothetical protein KDK_19410 [Dictyobacter kobayashii]|uniref:Uncharacterized protein n=1 Tax=Dictyobacter kobayashii TaxID=2014872 RepID=A0A402AG94_9CHLR|nr:hypothetical protein KDK_19410 [Dictyobacter kobayashii]